MQINILDLYQLFVGIFSQWKTIQPCSKQQLILCFLFYFFFRMQHIYIASWILLGFGIEFAPFHFKRLIVWFWLLPFCFLSQKQKNSWWLQSIFCYPHIYSLAFAFLQSCYTIQEKVDLLVTTVNRVPVIVQHFSDENFPIQATPRIS